MADQNLSTVVPFFLHRAHPAVIDALADALALARRGVLSAVSIVATDPTGESYEWMEGGHNPGELAEAIDEARSDVQHAYAPDTIPAPTCETDEPVASA